MPMNDLPAKSWVRKFRCAFRGVVAGTRGQSSFVVHFAVTAMVLIGAAWLQTGLAESCLLVLCVATVLTAEMFNSALEQMVKAISDQPNQFLGESLDIASGAVLIAAFGAAIVGTAILGNRCGIYLGWWG